MNGKPNFADPANLEPRANGEEVEVPADATPLDFLQAVYRSPNIPLHSRLKASIEAAQYCHPKLSVVASVEGKDFADQLAGAIRRSEKVQEKPTLALPDQRLRRV